MYVANDSPEHTPDFSRQIRLLRNLEPPHETSFLLQVSLILGSSFACYLLAGWWVCAVWSVIYVGLQLCEKGIVRLVSDTPPLHHYALVLTLLTAQASAYCFMPLYLWFLGPDLAKFGALILITASSMHSMLHRATYPSILLCFLVPDAAVFAVIAISETVTFGMSSEAVMYLVAGLASCIFFASTFLQAYQRDLKVRGEIEERARAEVAKEASEAQFKSLFESAPISIRVEDLSGMKQRIDALNLSDPDDFDAYLDDHPDFIEACGKEIVVLDANRASLAQHGYTDKADMLKNVLRTLSPAALQFVRKSIEALHSGARQVTFETQILRADGTTRSVVSTWSVVAGHENTYARILMCSLDITEHRKSEDALRQAQKMEVVGQLTGGVAHDFNNLLTVIGGNLDLMENEIRYDAALAAPIKNAVARGAELTQRLLAFSRKQPLHATSINLDRLVFDIRNMLARTLGEEITITTRVEAGDWSAFADHGQVEAALLNMALNSRDAMSAGGDLLIKSSKARIAPNDDKDLEPGDYVVLAISDTGCGMTPDTLARAYEPFFTTKEVGKGTGLGLPSVYGFAKQSGGDVQIKSEVGVGTTVSLYLPRAAVRAKTRKKPPPAPKVLKGNGLQVLILEDDPSVSNYLARLIGSNGFDVLTADDADQARDVVNSGAAIDLLISDVMLPGGVRGPEFASHLLDASRNTGVVFISGRPSEANLSAYPNLLAAAVLQKPFTRAQLVDKIQEALNARDK